MPFNDLWGKALPATIRGRFFGHRQLWGGVLALGGADIVKRVLGDTNLVFPNNFGVLFLLPIAGGFVVDLWGYDTAFVLTAAVSAVGFGCAVILECARTKDQVKPSHDQKTKV